MTKVHLTLDIIPELKDELDAVATRNHMTLEQLIQAGIKFVLLADNTRPGGSVIFGLRADGGYTRITLTEKGK